MDAPSRTEPSAPVALPPVGLPPLALLGIGRMGTLLEEVGREQGFEIRDRFRSTRPLADTPQLREGLGGVVLVDFTVPEAVLPTVRAATALECDLVLGTTGWHEHLEEVRGLVEEAGTFCVHAANFSLGANLFYRLVEHAVELLKNFDLYDPYIREEHHRFKLDRPSGTAMRLQAILEDAYDGREVDVSSVRAGHIPGTHIVGFDSLADSLILEQRARGRRGFVEGALLAARWIAARRDGHTNGRGGFFSFQEILDPVRATEDGES